MLSCAASFSRVAGTRYLFTSGWNFKPIVIKEKLLKDLQQKFPSTLQIIGSRRCSEDMMLGRC